MSLANCRIKYCLLLALFEILLIPKVGLAQVLSTPTERVFETEVEELYLPPESGRLKLNLPNDFYDSKYFKLDRLPENINTRQIKFIGNSVFSTAELEALINSGQKETISKDNLRSIIERINLLYRDSGYITSGIFSEPKLERNGIIFIPVTEGKIENVEISGLTRLRDNYVLKRLFQDKQRIFNQDKLKEALQLLQINHLIENISATVVSGSSVGNNILEVEVEEDDQFYLEVSVDNLGNLTSGSLRRQLKANHDNVFGFGDRFFLGFTNRDGGNSLDNLSATMPINSHNGTVGVSYSVGELEPVQEPFDNFDIGVDFSAFQASLRQPIHQTPNQEFALGIAFSRQHTQTTLFDEPFRLNRGSDDNGELNVSALSFYQDYTKRGRRDRFDVRSQFSVGVDAFDATQNEDSRDSNFVLWRGQTSYLRKVATDLNLSLKSYWQLSDRPLIYLEQNPRKLFILDREEEAFLLRGYAQNSLAGDNGIFASAELQANVLKLDSLNSVLQLTPFVDFGTAWNNDDLEFDESTLASAGLGIRLLVGDSFRARVDWGIPLIEREVDSGSLQEDGITFNIEYRPF